MAKEKACKACRALYEGSKCPMCGSTESTDTHKGKVTILNPEKGEVAKHLKIDKKGRYAIK